MGKVNVAFCILIISIFLGACSDEDSGKNNNQDPIRISLSISELKMVDEGQNFAPNLFSVIHELQTNDENIVISPLSLNMALAMVWNGANGETKEAIQKAMGMGNYPQSEVNDYFKKLREAFIKTDPTVKLAIANSIWSKKGFPVKTSFYDINKNYFNAEVKEVDFSSPNTPNLINKWCSDNTNGLIKEMIKSIPQNAVMYLLNALYFKGEWSEKFKFEKAATQNATFKRENGSSISVKMMNQNSILSYYQDEYLSMTSLPFGNKAYSMIFILPRDIGSFGEMLTRLKEPGYFTKCINLSSLAEVDLFIPVFKTEYEIVLLETLRQLGMGIAFSSSADFSGISDSRLFISNVLQKCVISVDEKGAEAAAVTMTTYDTAYFPSTPPPKAVFRADRPFLFAIQENSTGVVLFMGKIEKPE